MKLTRMVGRIVPSEGSYMLQHSGPSTFGPLIKLAPYLCLGKTCSVAFRERLLGGCPGPNQTPTGLYWHQQAPVLILAQLRTSSWMSLDNLWGGDFTALGKD